MNKLTDQKNHLLTVYTHIVHLFCTAVCCTYHLQVSFSCTELYLHYNERYAMHCMQLCNFSFVNIEIRCFCQFRSPRFESFPFFHIKCKKKNQLADCFFTFLKVVAQLKFFFLHYYQSYNRKTLSDLSTRSFYRRSHKILSSSLSLLLRRFTLWLFVLMAIFFVSRSMRLRWKSRIVKRRE